MPTYSGYTTPTHTEGSIDEKYVRNYSAYYTVVSSIHHDDPGTIAALCPGSVWSSYWPTDLYALCRSKSAQQTQGNLCEWKVTVTYSSAPVDGGQANADGSQPSAPGGQNSNVQPDQRTWTITIDSNETTRILPYDVFTTKPVCASNTQRFDPPVEVPKFLAQFTFDGWKASGSDGYNKVTQYLGKVNQGSWNTFGGNFAEYTCLCKKYSLVWTFEPGHGWYWKKNVVILYNPEGWNPIKVLDAGTYELTDSTAFPFKPILDNSGAPVTSAVPLNGSGKVTGPNADGTYLSFNGYFRTSFTNII